MSKEAAEAPAKLSDKKYLKELETLQAELCRLQDWVKVQGLKVIVVFEGRDTAGKGGVIQAITQKVSPRVFRTVALPAPSDREKSQMYIQRYVQHFPAAGEIVLFDRSWYNRAGVEYVMGFCSKKEHRRFLQECPVFEHHILASGIILVKFWMEVDRDEQEKRFRERIHDPMKQWKLSPIDLAAYARWYDYSRARDLMLEATDTPECPWHIVNANDQKRARLNLIARLLELVPPGKVKRPKVHLPKRSNKNEYDDAKSIRGRNFVPERF
jgi:polyphosphate kinase